MRRGLKAALAAGALAAAGSVAGCVTLPGVAAPREALARRIADDAVSFNQAYGDAVGGQILLNILRSRDRLPRYYLAKTGIQDAPSIRSRQTGGVGSIPLGESGSPWGFGSLSAEREVQSRPSYAVQPYDAATLVRTAFQPIGADLFAHYWGSGWPRDMLLLLMVERIERSGPSGAYSVANEAAGLADDCAAHVSARGCGFVRAARDLLRAVNAAAQDGPAPADAREVCGLAASYGAATPVRPAPGGGPCPARIVIGADEYVLTLRSLDDAVYYIGELLRAGSMTAGADGVIEAPITVEAAGLPGARPAPLFRVARGGGLLEGREGPFAASVLYAGQRYVAGPAVLRTCPAPEPLGPCQDTPEAGDRTSSVISLLAELMALTQSPDAIRTPMRVIVE